MTTNLEVPTLNSYALNAGWLEQVPQQTTNNPTVTTTQSCSLGFYQSGWTPYPTYWYTYPTVDHRPIKLGLSEVEKLRSAAKRDAKLKKILEKFTDQIEVVVDFK